MRQDRAREGAQDIVGRHTRLRQRLLQDGAALIERHGLEDGALTAAGQMRGGQVHGAVAQAAELLDVERQRRAPFLCRIHRLYTSPLSSRIHAKMSCQQSDTLYM